MHWRFDGEIGNKLGQVFSESEMIKTSKILVNLESRSLGIDLDDFDDETVYEIAYDLCNIIQGL